MCGINGIFYFKESGESLSIMQTMNDALASLYMRGEVTLEEALKRSSDPTELLRSVGESEQVE